MARAHALHTVSVWLRRQHFGSAKPASSLHSITGATTAYATTRQKLTTRHTTLCDSECAMCKRRMSARDRHSICVVAQRNHYSHPLLQNSASTAGDTTAHFYWSEVPIRPPNIPRNFIRLSDGQLYILRDCVYCAFQNICSLVRYISLLLYT